MKIPHDGRSSPIVPVATDGHGTTTIGIRLDRIRSEVQGALVCHAGSPQRTAPEIRASALAPIPTEWMVRFRNLESDPSSLGQTEAVSAEFTNLAVGLALKLLGEAAEAATDVLAIGVHGFGCWELQGGERCYRELCNTTQIAEATGLTVVDDFPARDLVQGGAGGPVEAYGFWLLLADRSPVPGRRWRGVVELSPSVSQCTWVPPFDRKFKKEPPRAVNVCAGQRLLTALARRSPDGGPWRDAKLATQGKVIPAIVSLWKATAASLGDWHPEGVSALPLIYALEQSEYRQAAIPDLVTSGTRYLAEEVAAFVRHGLDHSRPVGELLLMGEGTHNGLLLQWLAELLPAVGQRVLKEPHQERTILAASIAALTLLHLWQIPSLTGWGGVPRVLGRLTPGSPSNWRRVLQEMTDNAPWLLPLREAM